MRTDHERVRHWLSYNAETGVLTWVRSPNWSIGINDVAGCPDAHGYIVVRLEGKTYKAHRVAWALWHGVWPTQEIDHINGDRSDNRILNLRDVCRRVNNENRRKAQSNNTTGFLGVKKCKDRWQARITVRGRPMYLGSFETAEAAHARYLEAKRGLHEGAA